MTADFSDLNRLAADISESGAKAGVAAHAALDHAGRAVRDEARKTAPTTGLPHYARTITHEVQIGPGRLSVEIGPEKGGQGSLGHILENGTAAAPPQKHLGPAFDRALPDFVRAVGEMGGDLL